MGELELRQWGTVPRSHQLSDKDSRGVGCVIRTEDLPDGSWVMVMGLGPEYSGLCQLDGSFMPLLLCDEITHLGMLLTIRVKVGRARVRVRERGVGRVWS